jgi:hypothetical protein
VLTPVSGCLLPGGGVTIRRCLRRRRAAGRDEPLIIIGPTATLEVRDE